MEVIEGIHRIDTMLGARRSSMYVICGARSSLLFDVGINGDPSTVICSYLEGAGIDRRTLAWIVVSHCDVDHFGGIADARTTFPDARLIAHRLDTEAIADFRSYLRLRGRSFLEPYGLDDDPAVLDWARSVAREAPLDGSVVGGEVIDLGGREVEVLHLPGHSPGHLGLRDRVTGTVLIADAALGTAVENADGSGAFPPTYRHLGPYLITIARLQAMNVPVLLTAHYPTFRGNAAQAFLTESAEFAHSLHRKVRDALGISKAGLTLAELIRILNDGSGNWPVDQAAGAMAFPAAAHVEALLSAGEAELVDGPGGTTRIKAIR